MKLASIACGLLAAMLCSTLVPRPMRTAGATARGTNFPSRW